MKYMVTPAGEGARAGSFPDFAPQFPIECAGLAFMAIGMPA